MAKLSMLYPLYGLTQFSLSVIEVFMRLHLVFYLNNELRLDGLTSGLLISLSLVISIPLDPFIGKYIDLTRQYFASYKPIIIFSIFILAGSLFGIFNISWSEENQFYLFLLLFIYQISYSGFLIPYLSLAKEIINKEEDILKAYSWRFFTGSLGAILGAALPALMDQGGLISYNQVASIMLILIIVVPIMSLIFLRPHHRSIQLVKPLKLKTDVNQLISNKPFKAFAIFFIFLSIGLGLYQTLAIYYLKNSLSLSTSLSGKVLAAYTLFFCISIPLTVKLAMKKGIINTIKLGFIGIIILILSLPFLPKLSFGFVLLVFSLIGVFSSVIILNDSYLSRIIDYHAYAFKNQRSNFIFGAWRMLDKSSRAIGIFIAGVCIDYTLPAKKTSVQFDLSYLFPAVVLIFFITAWTLLKINIFNKKHHEIIIKYLKKKHSHLIFSQAK